MNRLYFFILFGSHFLNVRILRKHKTIAHHLSTIWVPKAVYKVGMAWGSRHSQRSNAWNVGGDSDLQGWTNSTKKKRRRAKDEQGRWRNSYFSTCIIKWRIVSDDISATEDWISSECSRLLERISKVRLVWHASFYDIAKQGRFSGG